MTISLTAQKPGHPQGWIGLSTDDKTAIEAEARVGDPFYETDTQILLKFNGSIFDVRRIAGAGRVTDQYIAPLETRTFAIDATGDRVTLTAGAVTPVIGDLMKFNSFPAAAKRARLTLVFPGGTIPFAHAFYSTVNAGTGTGDDAIAIARLTVVNFAPGSADAGDTAQRIAGEGEPAEWNMDLGDPAAIIENCYILPVSLGGTGAGTVVGTLSIW